MQQEIGNGNIEGSPFLFFRHFCSIEIEVQLRFIYKLILDACGWRVWEYLHEYISYQNMYIPKFQCTL